MGQDNRDPAPSGGVVLGARAPRPAVPSWGRVLVTTVKLSVSCRLRAIGRRPGSGHRASPGPSVPACSGRPQPAGQRPDRAEYRVRRAEPAGAADGGYRIKGQPCSAHAVSPSSAERSPRPGTRRRSRSPSPRRGGSSRTTCAGRSSARRSGGQGQRVRPRERHGDAARIRPLEEHPLPSGRGAVPVWPPRN